MWFSKRAAQQPEIITLSLTNDSRDGLQRDIIAWLNERGPIEGHLTDADIASLAEFVKRWFPKKTLDDLTKVSRGLVRNPVKIENTPEEYLAPPNSQTAHPSSERLSPKQFLSYFVSLGIYGAIGVGLGYQYALVREKPDNVPDRSIHKDLEEITLFSSPSNAGKAVTRFIDFTAAVKKLSPEQKKKIIVLENRLPMPLSKFLEVSPNLDGPGPLRIDIQRDKSNLQALEAFDKVIADHSRDVELQPRQLLMWNGKLYHQATDSQTAEVAPPPLPYNRVAVHVAGNIQSQNR